MKKTVLSLFSGCGGFDLGFEGGFEVLAHSINDKIHPDWEVYNTRSNWVALPSTSFKIVYANDISTAAKAAWIPFFNKKGVNPDTFHLCSIVDLVKSAEVQRDMVFPKAIDVITGGFPCQDFSLAGKRKGFLSHKNHMGIHTTEVDEPTIENRGMLYYWMKRVVELVMPKVFVAENVKGLVNLANAKAVIENDFKNSSDGGYVVVSARVINAAEYGVPQNRERMFFFGFRRSLLRPEALRALSLGKIPSDFDPYPTPTHMSRNQITDPKDDQNLKPCVTVGQAILDLAEPDDVIDDLSQASYSKARWYGNHCQGQTEVNLDTPGPTIRAEHHGNIEFRRLSKEHDGRYEQELAMGLVERRLTVRECARIQTFPDDYEFVRNRVQTTEFALSASDGYRLIGNAVPPLLAYHIARRLEELWAILFKEVNQ